MATGRVVRFDDVRGYGFITPDEGGEDVFVHANDLLDGKYGFTPGAQVEFKVMESGRGLKGYDVAILHSAPAGDPAPRVQASPVRADEARGDEEGGNDRDDEVCDILSTADFRVELTEVFLRALPELTGSQITQLRDQVIRVATSHGWVES